MPYGKGTLWPDNELGQGPGSIKRPHMESLYRARALFGHLHQCFSTTGMQAFLMDLNYFRNLKIH